MSFVKFVYYIKHIFSLFNKSVMTFLNISRMTIYNTSKKYYSCGKNTCTISKRMLYYSKKLL